MAATLIDGHPTLQQYIAEIRDLLQDVDGVRYPTSTVVAAINNGVREMFRLRPDIFRHYGFNVMPTYLTNMLDERVCIDMQYLPALTLYATGWVGLRDEEGGNDERAAALMTSFAMKLTQLQI